MRLFEFADEPGTRVVLLKVYPAEADKITEDEALRTWNMSEFRVCALDQQKLSQALADALETLQENPPMPSMELEEAEPEPIFVCAVGEHVDADCRIELTEDHMQAELIITAAQGGRHLETTDVKEAITESKVTHGVQFDWINRLVKEAKVAEPGSEVRGIIAEGTPAGPGVPSSFEFLVVPFEDRVLQPKAREDGSLDMHDLGQIEVVDVGQPLVRRIPSRPGDNGSDVLGNVIMSQALKDEPFDIGEGTEVSSDDVHLLIAQRHGVPLKLQRGMKVSEVLVVRDVDLQTGNVDYDGSVMIQGDVKNGMHVEATADVYVNGFVENARITAKGDVIIKQGIIGKANATKDPDGHEAEDACLIQGRNVIARYAQHAFIEAENNVEMGVQLLHCRVLRCRELHVGNAAKRKAKLVGGVVNLSGAAHVGTLGSVASTQTVLNFDLDAQPIQRDMKSLQNALDQKLETINGLLEAILALKKLKPSPELIEKMRKAKNTVDQLRTETDGLLKRIELLHNKLEPIKNQCQLHIYGVAYPNVELHFMDIKYILKEERKTCHFGISQDRWCNI